MSQQYDYTKTIVNAQSLKMEIIAAGITTTLENINWSAPDSLAIIFVEALSTGDKTTLDDVVDSHNGTPPNRYRLLCATCEQHISDLQPTTPTKCPVCEGTSISDTTQQEPFHTDSSPDGTTWDLFITNGGTIITAKRP